MELPTKVIELPNNCCPECNSSNIRRKFWAPISKEGHLPKPPVDFCDSCGFKSVEPFWCINLRNKRSQKIETILTEDGI
jgi:hypothetical protein